MNILTQKPLSHTLTRILTLVAFGTALSACGGSGSSSGGETRQATPTISTTTTAPTPTNNTTANTRAMSFVSDYKGNNEFVMTKPTGKLATELNNVLTETNKLRAEKGLAPLVIDERLSAYAQLRAGDLVKLFEHKRPNGQEWYLGIATGRAGENLAYGENSDTGAKAVTQWRNSTKGHYEAIINSTYTKVGLGVVYVPNNGYYWVQIFGNNTTKTPYSFTANQSTTNTNPLNSVIVNGVTLPIAVTTQGNWRQVNGERYTTWVNGYNNSRFGAVKYAIGDNTSVFYQGNQTPSTAIPTTGQATYNGQALIVKNGVVSTNVQSQFNANFANKTLNGTLTQNGATIYNLSADINGSGFASKSGATVQTQGAFFGATGEELGGTFNDTATGTTGAYGAKK